MRNPGAFIVPICDVAAMVVGPLLRGPGGAATPPYLLSQYGHDKT